MGKNQLVDQVTHASTENASGISPRAGCFLLGLIGAVLLLAVFSAGTLALRGEIRLPLGELREMRVWLVNDADNLGLAFSTARLVPDATGGARRCVETHVRFLLWRSDGSPREAIYCDCYSGERRKWAYDSACDEGRMP